MSPARNGTNITSVVEDVVMQIKKMIMEENYQVGDRLPPERQLAQAMGVSRNTVREAIHYFEALGAVETIIGSGTYLIDQSNALTKVFDMKQLIEKYNFNEMMEAREILEKGTVALAARRATREDKQKLRQLCMCMEKIQSETPEKGYDMFMVTDYEFHRQIAIISRNTIMQEMIVTIRDMLKTAFKILGKAGQTRVQANISHRKILEAVVNNDPEKAAEYMSKHILEQMAFLEKYYREMGRNESIE